MDIILDTNILRQSWFLNSAEFRTFLDYVEKTQTKLVIPEIVLHELHKLYENELRSNVFSLNKSQKNFTRLLLDNSIAGESKIEISELSAKYEQYIKTKLNSFWLQILPIKDSYLQEAIIRWRKNSKPFSQDRDSFRDSLIWSSVLEYLNSNISDNVVFISDNIRDFGNSEGSDLHPELRSEVVSLDKQLSFFRSLKDFNATYADRMSFITKAWLIENINWPRLDSKAKLGMERIHCAFYYEDSYRRMPEVIVEHWRVIDAKYDRQVGMPYVTEQVDKRFSVHLFLCGQTNISYLTSDGAEYPCESMFT